jgi:hypothetical protein
MGEASRAQTAEARERTPVPSIARHRVDRFVDVLERTLAESDVGERLCKAGVRVRIDLKDLPGTGSRSASTSHPLGSRSGPPTSTRT